MEERKDDKIKIVFNEKKFNGALVPEIIYETDSIIQIDRDLLIKILQKENEIRLSDETKKLYDIDEELETYADLDLLSIKNALIHFGFDPEKDDSLKAYHLATGRHLEDLEVKEQVVWLKYD